jgi:DNA-binding transcriptional MerR regulator
MRLSISEMAKLSGVSVRTLRYYDQIGLLCPEISENSGYRWYGKTDVERMQQILFYRELEFSLKEIAAILSDPQYDKQEALRRQRHLLQLKRMRLDRLLKLLEANLKGERTMEFAGFDRTEYETARQRYAEEAEKRWGATEAWRESQAREQNRTQTVQDRLTEEMNDIFRRFAALRETDPASEKAQAVVRDWQAWIRVNHYPCTREILKGLGEMYTADSRFRENLERFGSGTAAFMAAAIAAYTR